MADPSHTRSKSGGLELSTLIITAMSSAAAAYVCSKIWAPGTLASAAFTPVIVALIREGLDRPRHAVTAAVPVVARRRTGGTAEPPPVVIDPVQSELGPVRMHSTRTRRRWRVAIATGLLGFLVAAVAFTVTELAAGDAAGGDGRATTFFGGKHRHRSSTPTTTTAPAATDTVTGETRTVTAPTTTVTAPRSTTPTVTTPAPAPAPTPTTTETSTPPTASTTPTTPETTPAP
jgi:hypothetical protein